MVNNNTNEILETLQQQLHQKSEKLLFTGVFLHREIIIIFFLVEYSGVRNTNQKSLTVAATALIYLCTRVFTKIHQGEKHIKPKLTKYEGLHEAVSYSFSS